MKKLLLFLVIITSCNNQREEDEVVFDKTNQVLWKADSVLENHNKVKEENLKVLNQIIEKYQVIHSDTLKK